MNMYVISMSIAVSGMLLYHISQRLIPSTANPLNTLIIAYGIAIIVCFITSLVLPKNEPLLTSLQTLHWSNILLGVAVALIEIGVLLVYRSGWNISIAPIFNSTVVTLLLIPISLFFFKDQRLSLTNMLGFVFCIMGLILVSRK